jgi:hypothetical protein
MKGEDRRSTTMKTYHVQYKDLFGIWIDEPCRGRTREDARALARHSRLRIARDGSDFHNFNGGFVAVDVRVVEEVTR